MHNTLRTSVDQFAGSYYCPELDLNCKITTEENEVSCLGPDSECNSMEILFKDTFRSKYNGIDVLIGFTGNSNSGITGLMMHTGWIKDLRFNLLSD